MDLTDLLLIAAPLAAPAGRGRGRRGFAGSAPRRRMDHRRRPRSSSWPRHLRRHPDEPPVTRSWSGSVLRVDALTAFMLIVIGSVGAVATWASLGYVDAELASGEVERRDARRYGTLVPAFLAAMVLAVLADNLGVLWVAVEATTIVTAFLVGHRRSRGAVEAAWKYVVICSVGIALAFLGTDPGLLRRTPDRHPRRSRRWTGTSWPPTPRARPRRDADRVRRCSCSASAPRPGMVPLHSWLPDAHSQAPAPVSALMSGVLLPVAFYALVRYRVIAVGRAGPRLRAHPPAGHGAGLAGARHVPDDRPARLQAAARLLEHRTHGAGRHRAGHRHAAGASPRSAAHPRPRTGQGRRCSAAPARSWSPNAPPSIAGVRGLLARRPVLAATFVRGVRGAARACHRSACSSASSASPEPPPPPGSPG